MQILDRRAALTGNPRNANTSAPAAMFRRVNREVSVAAPEVAHWIDGGICDDARVLKATA
jgi:hypothetical protein